MGPSVISNVSLTGDGGYATCTAGDAWLHWSVVEMDARAVPGAHAALCLVFAREGCIRRVWNYPIDWRALDDDELASLSWNR